MSNPNNPKPGLPSNDMMIMNWVSSQARSQNNSNAATTKYQAYVAAHIPPLKSQPVYAPGEGSVTPGSYTTNGLLPNAGNTPQ